MQYACMEWIYYVKSFLKVNLNVNKKNKNENVLYYIHYTVVNCVRITKCIIMVIIILTLEYYEEINS